MVYCVAYGCHNDSKYTKGVSYYRLMAQPPFTRAAWLEKLNANKNVSVTSNSVVCSKHFESDCFVRDLKSELMGCRPRRYLRKGSVPTIFTIPDESEKGIPKKRRGRKKAVGINKKTKTEINDDEGPRCDYCLLTSASNILGVPEELLACKDCNAKAHPSCMDYTPILAERSRLFPWQCIDCKTCTMCEDSGDAGSMLFCDACDRGFHMECHIPPIKTKPTGNWMCSFCAKETGSGQCIEKEKQERLQNFSKSQTNGTLVNGLNGSLHSSDSLHFLSKDITVSNETKKDRKGTPSLLSPKAEEWTIEEVVKYFTSAGFPSEALAFREQEIDGRSLLLMKRSDVLTGLSIRLGPALKIYNHVKRLQTCDRSDFI